MRSLDSNCPSLSAACDSEGLQDLLLRQTRDDMMDTNMTFYPPPLPPRSNHLDTACKTCVAQDTVYKQGS